MHRRQATGHVHRGVQTAIFRYIREIFQCRLNDNQSDHVGPAGYYNAWHTAWADLALRRNHRFFRSKPILRLNLFIGMQHVCLEAREPRYGAPPLETPNVCRCALLPARPPGHDDDGRQDGKAQEGARQEAVLRGHGRPEHPQASVREGLCPFREDFGFFPPKTSRPLQMRVH